MLKHPKRNGKPGGEKHQKAPVCREGPEWCEYLCAQVPRVSLLRLVACVHTYPLHGCDINSTQPGENQGIVPSHASPIHPRAAHSQDEAQTVHAKLNHCKPNPKPGHPLLGTVPFWLGNLDSQSGEYKFPAKGSPSNGERFKTKLDTGERPLQLQLNRSLFDL